MFLFQSGNAKIEQRFVLGNGVRKFLVKRANHGALGAITHNAPDGQSYTCRFADTTFTNTRSAARPCFHVANALTRA